MRLLSHTALLALAAGIAAPAAAPAQVASVSAVSAPVLQVNTGRGRLVTLTRPMSDLFISDDAIADVQVRSPTQLYIFGKKSGETTVSATAKSGAVVYSATVRVGNNLDSIGQMLAMAMPEAKIVATPMNGLVLLTGAVAQPQDAAEAERLVQAFVGDGTKVLSRLRTATPLQVSLQVRIAEVSRSFIKNIGNNLVSRDTTGGFTFGVAQGRNPGSITATDLSTYPYAHDIPLPNGGYINGAFDPATGTLINPRGRSIAEVSKGPDRTTLGFAGKVLGLDLLSAIDLGETIGQVSTLANTNLTASSGETANFLAGGEIPIPVSQGLGGISIEYKSYGVSLSYTPTVLSDGRISLRVRPEVSQLTSDGAVSFNGTVVPAFTTRRAESTLELGSGQSLVLGGLMSNTHNNSIDKTPGLGDLPVLGALFRSNGFRRNETELMIVITPYLVKPVSNPGDIVLPTDGLKAPTDAERLLLGEVGSGTTGAHRPVPTAAIPSAPAPTVGALMPASPAPGRDDRHQATAATADPRATRRGSAPTPGFSN